MKVLHLYSGNLYGGIETLLTTMARSRSLAPEMEPEFGLCFRGRLWDELVATGAAVHCFGPVRLSRPWTVARARGRLRQVLAESRPEVVVTHDSWPHTVFAPVVRRAGIRLVHFIHGLANRRHWLDRLASRNLPDQVVANSQFSARLAAAVYPGVPVEGWHAPGAAPAVSGSVRAEVRSELGTSEGTVVILQASRLELWKGQAVHLTALGQLREVPGWECWLAGGVQKGGEARFMSELRLIADRAGIADRVRFLGQRSDVPRLMASADVFCQPNTGPEPYGIVLVEALRAGLPVVTSGFGGAAEIVDESCGVLTRPGDASSVAAALRSLIHDASLRRTLGKAGPDRAQVVCDPTRQFGALARLLCPTEVCREVHERIEFVDRRPAAFEPRDVIDFPPTDHPQSIKNERQPVLHLYSGNLYGGIETFLTTMARSRHLAPGLEPEFGLCFRGRLWDELVATGVAVHCFGPVRLSRPWTVAHARGRLRRVLAESRPEVVVTHDLWPHVVFAPEVLRAGIRLVHFVHGPASGLHWLERLASRNRPDLVVATSRFTAASVPRVFPEARVEVWHYPVAHSEGEDRRAAVRSELGATEGAVVILQASRLERWKGHSVHLAALGLLRDLPGWECWLAGGAQKVGERQFLDELKSIAERSGIIDRVRFLGQRTDIDRLMSATDVFCQPNTGPEPFGIVLVEALYAGLPVVTSGFGGAAEIVDPTCGVLTTPGDAESVAAALRSLIQDPSKRRELATAGPSRARSLCDAARQLNAVARLLQPLGNGK